MGLQQRREVVLMQCRVVASQWLQEDSAEQQPRKLQVMRIEMQPDLSVNDWTRVLQSLTSQHLSCSAVVSSGSAKGIMMQQFEREVHYRCSTVSGRDMGSSTESSSTVDGGQ